VKATTSERLGFIGREEGIAATASATIRLPWQDSSQDPWQDPWQDRSQGPWEDKGWSE
jgi:2-C-methyl-D-erythritol 4-phosphate cytidylyltransferase/2-C-methyl-D-erythritol 2,4-cyclodiphosphate synthase